MPELQKIDRATDALLVIDLQPDFMPGGPLAVFGGADIVDPIARFIDRFDLIVATQDWHPAGHVSFASTHGKAPFSEIPWGAATQTLWPDHCIQATPGAALDPRLPTGRLSLILRKGMHPDCDSYSAFFENADRRGIRRPTGLAGYLRERGVRRVFVAGLALDFCVKWTALDAASAGFATFCVTDLSRPVSPANVESVLDELRRQSVATVLSGSID